jgi:hypothetical protein
LPATDDATWEEIDLTPVPGARDGDVGITHYLHGWRARGHGGYWGYAWYRKRISIAAPEGGELAMLAPNDVEDAYQLFCNGKLIGEAGDFSGRTPVVYSPKPQMFSLMSCVPHGGDAVISVRVWMGPITERDDDAGGIHVAPAIGEQANVAALYRSQWAEIWLGYIVDAVEPLCLLLVAALAWVRTRRLGFTPAFRYSLCAALLLTALVRANQAWFAWTNWESLHAFMVAKYTVLLPMGMAAWAMMWVNWLVSPASKWVMAAKIDILCLAIVMVAASMMGEGYGPLGPAARLAMAFLFLALAVGTVVSGRKDRVVMLVVMTLICIGQFAGELSMLRVPGIWFPFGIGVSRTQFAYAALVPCLLIWLLGRKRVE